ncbi:MAG: bifunctional 5,10-methylenetetrahydrofolate dehydrogenase/5,10-methenyltetrahydrofolate cyclohydrolase [bacterium]|nr:bifunctional 5,10-methylenetetrahydrofolate dehydrogenase/5,10-methenyltetrahydrofolate cyclohydrolase [bacterium]
MKVIKQIIDGRKIAEKIKDEITAEIFENGGESRPSLAIILVGDRPDSKLYVSLKEREAIKVSIDTHIYRLEEESSEAELLTVIDFLNKDESVDAILLQLPLPISFDTDKMIAAISPYKDADGFHPYHPEYVLSPVIAAVDYIAKQKKITGRACVFHRSAVFGESFKSHLEKLGLQVDLLPVKEDESPLTDNALRDRLTAVSKKADLIVTALGLPLFLNEDYVREGAVIVDIGINTDHGHVHGDVDFDSAANNAAAITPVPGGIGPMTIAFLFKNVVEIYRRRQ